MKAELKNLNAELVGLLVSAFERDGDADAIVGVVADWLEERQDPRADEVREGKVWRLTHEVSRAKFLAESRPTVGKLLEPDGWKVGKELLADDTDMGAFRIRSQYGFTLPVNITVSGWTLQRRGDTRWVRVRIEFVQDGEPNTQHKGWLRVN
jgi:hypothetical protein